MKRKRFLAVLMAVLCSVSVLTVNAADAAGTGGNAKLQTETSLDEDAPSDKKLDEEPKISIIPTPSETPEDEKEPEPSETPEDEEEPKPSEMPEDEEEPKPSETPEDEEEPKPSETPEDEETPKPSETPKVTETPDGTDAPESSKVPASPVKNPAAKAPSVRAIGNSNTLVNTNPIIDDSSCSVWRSNGSGTLGDPYYMNMTGNPNGWVSADKGVFKVQAADVLARIDGESRLKSFPLNFGDNTIQFFVLASDGETIEYYKVDGIRRNKRYWNARPSGLSGVSPTRAGASDGKIIGLDSAKPYEYRLGGGEWIAVPAGSTEITGLAAGSYEVCFGENEEYEAAQGWTTRVTVVDPVEYSIELERISTEISSILSYPKKAVGGTQITFTFSKPVKVLSIEGTKRKPDAMMGVSETLVDENTGTQYIDGDQTIVTATAPELKEGQVLYINEIELADASTPETKWYSIQNSTENNAEKLTYCQEVVTGQRKVQDGGYVYSEGSKARVYYKDRQENPSVLYKALSFKVVDENKNTIAESPDASPLIVEMKGNYTVVPEVQVIKELAELSGLKEAVSLAPAEDEHWRYTDTSVSELVYCLEWSKAFFDREILKKDQNLVDDCETRLRAAIDALEFRPGDYTKVEEAIQKAPQDLDIYTEESVAALQKAIAAVERDLDMSRQEDIWQFAEAIEGAIEALVFLPGDYTKVEEALNKIPKNLDIYTEESVAVLQKAKDAVVKDLDITHQEEIDKFAEDILAAIRNLKEKPLPTVTPTPEITTTSTPTNKPAQTEQPVKDSGQTIDKSVVKTGDDTNVIPIVTMLGLSAGIIFLVAWKRRRKFHS